MNSTQRVTKGLSKEFFIVLLAVVLLVLSPLLSICFGAADISFQDVFAIVNRLFGGEADVSAIKERIVLELRLPRIILAFLAGAGLSLSGAVLQTVTRNPLADPYLFGISSGASFGAVLVIASVGAASSVVSITGGAFLGGALSVLMVVSLAGMGVQIERMLLAGVAVQFMFSSATSLVLYLSDPQAAASLLFWILGSFTRASWDNLLIPTVIVIFCLCVFLAFSRPLRAILSGDESAKALGVEVYRLRIGMLLLSSLLTATLVASCGGIGFVGLMVPHIVRRILINRSQYVLVGSAVFGGVFMIWVDVLARMLMENSELPVGVITAAMGSLFFLLVLKNRATGA